MGDAREIGTLDQHQLSDIAVFAADEAEQVDTGGYPSAPRVGAIPGQLKPALAPAHFQEHAFPLQIVDHELVWIHDPQE